jgi:hypothetical protein
MGRWASSISVKSLSAQVARSVAPLWLSARLPPPCSPHTGDW